MRNCVKKCVTFDHFLEESASARIVQPWRIFALIFGGKRVDGGRGRSRTDMRLPSADFEFPENTVSLW
jgi:hypothetical protein